MDGRRQLGNQHCRDRGRAGYHPRHNVSCDQLSPFGSDFWKSSISASGAWTVGDSWATNIVAIVAVLGTILGITSAANSLFPGVGLDRFVILNTIAGRIAAAAPLVFGVLYARWTAKNPGLTVDAQVRQPVTACLAGNSE